MNALDSNANGSAMDSLMNYETVKYFNNDEHEIKCGSWTVCRIKKGDEEQGKKENLSPLSWHGGTTARKFVAFWKILSRHKGTRKAVQGWTYNQCLGIIVEKLLGHLMCYAQ